MVSKDELLYTLDCVLEWLENSENKERIAHLIAEILADVAKIRRDL